MKYIGLFDEKEDIVTKEKLDAVASRVSTNEDNIAMAESDIDGLQTTVGTLQTNVNNIQTALASKQDTVVGGASTITEDNLTASRALVSNSSGKVAVSTVTSTEIGYLDGVTSNVQTQLDSKQPTITVNGIIKGDGAGNLSAQDTVAAELVDLPTVPTKVSELTNDANYITAAQAPVQSVNNKTGAVSLTASDVSAIPSTLTGTAGQVLTKTADGQEWKDETPRDVFFGVEGFLQDQDVLLLDPDGFSDLTSQWNQLANAGHSTFTNIGIPMPCIDVRYNADSENTIVLRYAGLLENQAIFSGIYYDATDVKQYAISLLYGLGAHGFSGYSIIPVRNIVPSTATPLAPTEAGSVGTSTDYARGDHTHPKELPTVSADDNSKILQVVGGQWATTDETNIAPTIGANGNWYIGGVDSGKPSRGATGATGATGAQGPQGKGLQILGYYATLDALTAAVTSPAAGDAYGVGTAEPYNIYVWDGVGNTWVNNGTAVGVEGNYLAKENPTGTGDLTLLGCNRVTINTEAPEEATGVNSFLFGNSETYVASGRECVSFNGEARANYSFAAGGVVGTYADYGFAGPDSSVYGSNSTAFGILNSVEVAGQTAIGAYCIVEAKTKRRLPSYTNREGSWCGKNLFVIGNGTGWSERHNAFEVDWDGNVWAQGSLEGTALILKSSTAGSEKRFVVRVNDAGVLSVEDIDTLNYVMTVNVSSGKTLLAVKDLYTEEEITAIPGQQNQYPVKYGHSYYVEYQSGQYKPNKLVCNVTDNTTVSI